MVHGCWALSSGTPWASALSRPRPEQAMAHPRELLQQLFERRDLSQAQAEELLAHLTDPQLPPAMAGAMLAALSTKGLVADEVRGFAQAMRRLARRPDLPAPLRAIDIVGTGGDAPPKPQITARPGPRVPPPRSAGPTTRHPS